MSAKNYGSKSFDKDKNSESLAVLKDNIKSKTPGRVYLFHGNEPFLIDHYVSELKKLVLENDSHGLNLSTFENKVKIGDLIDCCDTFPVFAEKKLVIVKNSLLFFNKSKKEAQPSNDEDNDEEQESSGKSADASNKPQDVLKQYIPELPDTTCLIFIESQVDKRLGAYKQLTKHGLVIELNKLSQRELVPWVLKGARQLGKSMSEEAAQYLVTVSEPDMYALKNEILKLSAYKGEIKEISLSDVKLLATATIKSVIFDLLDAVAQKNSQKALSLLADMLALKEPEQKILSMLSKQTGEILKLKYLLKSNASQTDINQYFPGKHPYALKMLVNQAQGMDESYLKELLKGCMEAETGYKKGKIAAKLSLEVLMASVSNCRTK